MRGEGRSNYLVFSSSCSSHWKKEGKTLLVVERSILLLLLWNDVFLLLDQHSSCLDDWRQRKNRIQMKGENSKETILFLESNYSGI